MKSYLQNQIAIYRQWRKHVFMISLPELFLAAVVIVLGIMMFFITTRSNKGKLSITALTVYLTGLLHKFKDPAAIDAEAEREDLERLLNKVKASCQKQDISSSSDLKGLFASVCNQVEIVTENKSVGTRSAWQQLKDVMFGFDQFYFPKVI
jgi:hypothetical protein